MNKNKGQMGRGGGSATGNGGPPAPSGPVTGTVPPPVGAKPRSGFRAIVDRMESGFTNEMPSGAPITVAGTVSTREEVIAELGQIDDLFSSVESAANALKTARLQLEGAMPEAHQYLVNLKDAVIAALGRGNPLLAQFGIQLRKPTPRKTADKAASAERGRQTRQERGTLGKREKSKIRFSGKVTMQPVVTPAAAPIALSPVVNGAPSTAAPSAPTNGTGNGTSQGK
ncbi:MAG: hypothetical protein ACYCWW_17385 [Deltaproteobacteria bacterium]